ncbi:MAG TPA: tRNA (guanosine(46)-N7)-methyltransferase TrmB [Chthoniobacterales bacterium]
MSSDSSATIATGAELVPKDCFAALDLETIYGRRAPLVVDLGCGDGSFLAAIASENPAADFLGIERLLGRVRTACRRIERAGLQNARVLCIEIAYAVERMLPANSVAAFHLMFPDPWPKRRHAARRLVSAPFLVSIHRALRPDGTIRIATDDTSYFRHLLRLATGLPALFVVEPDAVPLSTTSEFERRFTQRGVEIHRVALRKISPLT